MKNILLISPASDNEALWVTGNEGPEIKNNMVPLGLATLAGLTPEGFRVDIWDELVHGRIDDGTVFERSYDLVGITGFKAHLPRCRQLAEVFHRRSIPVAIGGPGVSGTPHHYRGYFDILFIGEAEKTWPRFLRDWQSGAYRSEYIQVDKPDLAESPLPDWRSIASDLAKYAFGCVQTTRGCPFDCEFCDVIYLFGRRPRHKPIKNVLEEVRVLKHLGMSDIFFNDDEFASDHSYTKELLRELIRLNDSFTEPLSFSTQVGIGVCKSEELLELLRDANFKLLFMGLETPNVESIKEANKNQNLRHDMVDAVHRILSHGIAVRAGIIVGFDHDDTDIFDIQYNFIQRAFLPSVTINMLKAPLATRLWARLRQEGRVVSLVDIKDRLGHPRSYTNIVPKLMTRVELMRGYRNLLERVFSWKSFSERMRGFISLVKRRPRYTEKPLRRDEVVAPAVALGIGPEGIRAIDDIMEYAERTAPFMLRRVKELVVQHSMYLQSVVRLLPQLDRQIEIESRGELKLDQDRHPILVTASIRKAYNKVFPDVMRYVCAHLRDANRLPEALVDVFVDFLVRCGDDLGHLEDFHRSILKEICDRACVKLNGRAHEVSGADGEDVGSNAATAVRLGDEVLKSVERELVKLSLAGNG